MALVSHDRPVARLDAIKAYFSYISKDEKQQLFRELRCLEPQLFESIAKESTEEITKRTSGPARNGRSGIAPQNPTPIREQESSFSLQRGEPENASDFTTTAVPTTKTSATITNTGSTTDSTVQTATTNALQKASNKWPRIPKCFPKTPSEVMQLLYSKDPETFFMKNDQVSFSDILDSLLQINNNEWLSAIHKRFHAIALYCICATEKQKATVRDEGQVFSDFIRRARVRRQGITNRALVSLLKDHCKVGGRYMNLATGLSWSVLLLLRPERHRFYESGMPYLEGTALNEVVASTLKAQGAICVDTITEGSIECELEKIACNFRDWIQRTWQKRIALPTTNPGALVRHGTKSQKRKQNDYNSERSRSTRPREPLDNRSQLVAVDAHPSAETTTYTPGAMTGVQPWPYHPSRNEPYNPPTSYSTKQQVYQLDSMMAAQDWQPYQLPLTEPYNPPAAYSTEQQAYQLDSMMAAQDWQPYQLPLTEPYNPPAVYPSSDAPQTDQPYEQVSYTAYTQRDKDILPSSDIGAARPVYTPTDLSGFGVSNNEPAPGEPILCA